MDAATPCSKAPSRAGMILEDNDASVGGVYVKNITPNSPAGEAQGLMEGAQIVSINGKTVKGTNFDSVMEILRAAESPVDIQFYDVGLCRHCIPIQCAGIAACIRMHAVLNVACVTRKVHIQRHEAWPSAKPAAMR